MLEAFSPCAHAEERKERNFYEVLEDLVADFEYDLKNGAVQGLKDVAIRNIATSENVPPSFKSHLELIVTERILKTSKTRMVQCLACRAKKTTLNGDQVTVNSAENNPVELSRIAKANNIATFMDLAFSYQPKGMVLSMFLSEPDSGTIIWSRSYNSETSRASAFRRGSDFSQTDEARRQTEYAPMIQYRLMVGYLFEPNIADQTGCLALGFRMMERYDNRKKEVGFELDYLKDSSTITGSDTSTNKNIYNGVNLTLLFMHAWNLIGEEENYNLVRGSIFGGVGGTYASSYLSALVRAGYEWRLAKHYGVQLSLGYRPESTAFLGTTDEKKVSGLEYGLGLSILF